MGGEADIEIIPEMLKAGPQACAEWDRRVEEPDGLVISVFQAMAAASPKFPALTDHFHLPDWPQR